MKKIIEKNCELLILALKNRKKSEDYQFYFYHTSFAAYCKALNQPWQFSRIPANAFPLLV